MGNHQGPRPAVNEFLARELQERVKELNCLFRFSEIVERSGASLDQILTETVELLPSSWEYSEVACARITLADREFKTGNYAESPWKQGKEILVDGRVGGVIEISYLEKRPASWEGPFNREERRLLNALAERLGHVIERLTAADQLREAEEDLRARMTHLTRVSTLGEMASSIAHEINQPLTAISTYAQACRRMMDAGTEGKTEVTEILQRISDEALRAGAIIHRLRALVKRRVSQPVECDFIQLLEEITPLALGDARLHDVEVRLILPPALPPVLADHIQIQQVILNLIRNGIDAMEGIAPVDRALEIRLEMLGDEQVQLSVSDRGCGLPEGSEEALFQPFFTTKEDGLGMGLSISKSIISAHGGRLWFSRNPNGGTTFLFTLPSANGAGHDCPESHRLHSR